MLYGFRPRWIAGIRGEYAKGEDLTDPLQDQRYRLSANLTFYPSEFSKWRLQYNYDVRGRVEQVPQEAIIGIVYAVTSAGAILALDRAPHGADQIKSLLVGSILWVSVPDVVKLLAICGLGGLFHWVFRKQFLLISFGSGQPKELGLRLRWWDFLFYACSFKHTQICPKVIIL